MPANKIRRLAKGRAASGTIPSSICQQCETSWKISSRLTPLKDFRRPKPAPGAPGELVLIPPPTAAAEK